MLIAQLRTELWTFFRKYNGEESYIAKKPPPEEVQLNSPSFNKQSQAML